MRQLLMNMSGVIVARMPRPVVQPGTVLIRVQYSLVSVGTEVAPLRPSSASAPDTPAIERNLDRSPAVQTPAAMRENLSSRLEALNGVADCVYGRWTAGLRP